MAAHAVHSAQAQLKAAPRMSVCGFIEGMTPEEESPWYSAAMLLSLASLSGADRSATARSSC